MQSAPITIAYQRRRLWNDFLAFVDRHQEAYWIFRGVADKANHALVPKVGRNRTVYNNTRELVIFRNFKRRAPQFIDVVGRSEWDLLAVAQHHNLPTRLLDWSINPLVAAYFAVTSNPTHTDASVYAVKAPPLVDIAKDPGPFASSSVKTYVPSALSPRIVAQRGLFTIHPVPTDEWKPLDLRTFDIPAAFRLYFERRLFQVAVEASAVKADLDGICDTLAWQYQRRVAVGSFNY